MGKCIQVISLTAKALDCNNEEDLLIKFMVRDDQHLIKSVELKLDGESLPSYHPDSNKFSGEYLKKRAREDHEYEVRCVATCSEGTTDSSVIAVYVPRL